MTVMDLIRKQYSDDEEVEVPDRHVQRLRKPGRRKTHTSRKAGPWTLLQQHIISSKRMLQARNQRALDRSNRAVKELELRVQQAREHNERLERDHQALKEQNKIFARRIKQIKEKLQNASKEV